MRKWEHEWLVRMAGSHVASEPGARIQVVEVPQRAGDLFEIGTGQLLIMALRHAIIVETEVGDTELAVGDQALLGPTDRFRLRRVDNSVVPVAELIWMPGISTS